MNLLKTMLGMCVHRKISRPVTLGKGADKATYVCCLSCGHHLPVEDWRIVANDFKRTA
jgi:hypothetical protein